MNADKGWQGRKGEASGGWSLLETKALESA
jgi:hypothetical protein